MLTIHEIVAHPTELDRVVAIFTVGEARPAVSRPAARPPVVHRSEGNAAISKEWSEF